jgi:acetyl-CoA carboxylase biotin carboxylase subunit
MIAKVIVHARTRELAIARMRRALDAMVIEGIKTTIPLHLKIMDSPDFQAGNFSTRFMEEFLAKEQVREIPNVTASAALTGVSA